MQEFIPITRDELKQYAKVSLPQTVRSVGMQLNHADKRHVSYCFVWETDMGEQSIGTVAFDKTDEPRYYEKEGQIQTVTEPHWEQAIVMYAEANETPDSFGAYGITMAGVAKVCEQLKLHSMKRVLIRTDKTNGAALGFFKKIGLTAYPEYVRAMDKKKSELVPTSGQVFDTTVEEMSTGLRYFARRIPNMLSRAAHSGR
ncbi:MAG: hypothetical protein ACI4QM_03040 [Alphaproteobacteria bacterium]